MASLSNDSPIGRSLLQKLFPKRFSLPEKNAEVEIEEVGATVATRRSFASFLSASRAKISGNDGSADKACLSIVNKDDHFGWVSL